MVPPAGAAHQRRVQVVLTARIAPGLFRRQRLSEPDDRGEYEQPPGPSERFDRALGYGEALVMAVFGVAGSLPPADPSFALAAVPGGMAVAKLLRSALVAAVWGGRAERCIDFVDQVERDSGRSSEDIADWVRDRPDRARLVESSIAAAADTPDEAKRKLLVRVLANALRAEDEVRIDPLVVLVETVRGLEPYHLHVLAEMARRRVAEAPNATARADGATRLTHLVAWLQPDADLAGPVLAALTAAHLIEDVGSAVNGIPAWVETTYGGRLLRYLDRPELADPVLRASLRVTPSGAPAGQGTLRIDVRNIGPSASDGFTMEVRADGVLLEVGGEHEGGPEPGDQDHDVKFVDRWPFDATDQSKHELRIDLAWWLDDRRSHYACLHEVAGTVVRQVPVAP
jgi:hypothetical protein